MTRERGTSMGMSEHMTRRHFLERMAALGVAGGVATALLSACGTDSLAKTNITFWNLFGGGDGARMVEMENIFKKENPSIGLQAVTLSWGEPYYTKLAMAASGGGAPDIGVIHLSRLPAYAGAGLLEPIDLEMLEAVGGIKASDFVSTVWTNAMHDGKIYAIPVDTHPFILYYNSDICKKAGLTDANGRLKAIEGEEALIDAFLCVQKVTGNPALSMAIQDVMTWRLFQGLHSQIGGEVISADASQVRLGDKALKTLTFMSDLTQKHKVLPAASDYASSVAQFSSGKAGFHWNGEWEVTTFNAQKLPFGATLFPKVFGGQQTWADGHAFIMPRNSGADGARKEASIKFIASMIKNSYIWAQGGHIPPYMPVAESKEYQNLKPQSDYVEEAKHVVFDPKAWFSGAASDFQLQAMGAFSATMTGQLAPEQGLEQFRGSVQKLIDTPRPF